MICEGTHSLSQTLDASLQATFGAPAPSSTEHWRFFLSFPSLRVGLTKPWSANSGSWTAQRWCVSHFWIMFLRIIQHDLRIFCGTWLWVCTSTVWSEHSSALCVVSGSSATTVAASLDTKQRLQTWNTYFLALYRKDLSPPPWSDLSIFFPHTVNSSLEWISTRMIPKCISMWECYQWAHDIPVTMKFIFWGIQRTEAGLDPHSPCFPIITYLGTWDHYLTVLF